jgi:CHASE3 domain sensor protein/putative methionine-R-sulfoxide reductase with GAF domain
MKYLRLRKLYLVFWTIPLLLTVLGAFGYQILNEQIQSGIWIARTHEVIDRLEAISVHVSQAQNLKNIYLLTGKQEYLDGFSRMPDTIRDDIDRFQKVTEDNSHQQLLIPRLHHTLSLWLASTSGSMHEYNKLHTHPEELNAELERDSFQVVAINNQIDSMRAEEKRLLSDRMALWDEAASYSRLVFLGGASLIYLLAALVFLIWQKQTTQKEKQLASVQHTSLNRGMQIDRLGQIIAAQQDIALERFNLPRAMNIICERTQTITHADGAVVEMLEGDEMVYHAGSGTGAPHVGVRLKAKGSLSGKCVELNSVLQCDDALYDDRVDKEACRRVNLRSMIVVPLVDRGNAKGVLKVMSSQARAFDENHTASLQLMATVLSATLSDAMSMEEQGGAKKPTGITRPAKYLN